MTLCPLEAMLEITMMARSVPLRSARGIISLVALVGSLSLFFGGWLLSDFYRDAWLFAYALAGVLLLFLALTGADYWLKRKEPRPEEPADPYGQVTVEFGPK